MKTPADGHPHRDCLVFFEQLSAYVDQELDTLTCEQIELHAQNCAACQACIATLRQTIALCKQMKPPPPPEAFARRLRQMVRRLASGDPPAKD